MSPLYSNPLFGVTVTVVPYAVARAVERRHPHVHVLLTTCGTLVAVLLLCRVPYADYDRGGSLIGFFLGPATVALAVPLYDHAKRIGRDLLPLLAGVVAGTVASMVVGGGLAWLLGADRVTVLSMLPRGCTTPIAMDVSAALGGSPPLTAVFTGVSGLLGGLVGPALLRRAGVGGELATGAALGTASHGIGTARALRLSAAAGAAAAVAMTAAGLLTAVVAPLARWILPR